MHNDNYSDSDSQKSGIANLPLNYQLEINKIERQMDKASREQAIAMAKQFVRLYYVQKHTIAAIARRDISGEV